MAITLKEVAAKAGVSEATVSLSLNDSELVNENTKKRIKRIAKELNYVPDVRGRSLAKKASDTIGLVIPTMNNSFYSELSQSIKNKIKAAGYNLIICTTQGEVDEEIKYINMFRSGIVDGAIFATRYPENEETDDLVAELVKEYVPVVYLDRTVNDNKMNIPTIISDREKAAYDLTKKLIEFGHEDIGYAGVGRENDRFKGYSEALTDLSLIVKPEYSFFDKDNDSFRGGPGVGKKLLELSKLPTALMCFNDQMAISVIQYLIRNNIKVPKDISVTGFDNIEVSQFFNPALTTANVPKKEMGKKAASLLLDLIDGQETKTDMSFSYPVNIIIRESICKID